MTKYKKLIDVISSYYDLEVKIKNLKLDIEEAEIFDNRELSLSLQNKLKLAQEQWFNINNALKNLTPVGMEVFEMKFKYRKTHLDIVERFNVSRSSAYLFIEKNLYKKLNHVLVASE